MDVLEDLLVAVGLVEAGHMINELSRHGVLACRMRGFFELAPM
jgi:hypothetical protein